MYAIHYLAACATVPFQPILHRMPAAMLEGLRDRVAVSCITGITIFFNATKSREFKFAVFVLRLRSFQQIFPFIIITCRRGLPVRATVYFTLFIYRPTWKSRLLV